jgi:hypothetical protein
LSHFLAVGRGRQKMPARAQVRRNGPIGSKKALGVSWRLESCMRRSRCRVGWWEFSARLLKESASSIRLAELALVSSTRNSRTSRRLSYFSCHTWYRVQTQVDPKSFPCHRDLAEGAAFMSCNTAAPATAPAPGLVTVTHLVYALQRPEPSDRRDDRGDHCRCLRLWCAFDHCRRYQLCKEG